MIGILNAGLGNIKSVQNSLNYLSIQNEIIENLDVFEKKFSRLILPGVGSFNSAMSDEKIGKFVNRINDIKSKNFPILGICLGSQILCNIGYEGGKINGLGFINGDVEKIKTDERIPHIGWNNINIIKKHHIFENVTSGFCAYFVHSYRMNIYSMDQCFGTTLYGESFPSVVINKNVIGMQFHPEKSQKNGLKLLKNFSEFNAS